MNEPKELLHNLWLELTGVNLRDSASRVELLSGRWSCVIDNNSPAVVVVVL